MKLGFLISLLLMKKKNPKNYGILYLNKELIEQEERFHNIIFENEKQIQDLSLENNIY